MRLPNAFPPAGYVRVADGVVALAGAAQAVAAALEEAPSLARWAESRATRVVEGGRGPAWRVELAGQPVVVRHYRRGGWMGPLLDDRYFDRPPRPFAELAVSESLRAAGVPTPRVLAAAVYSARPGYRADLVTEWLSPGLDLEELLRPGLYPDAERVAAVETAGRTVGRAHGAGLDHPDLRPRNLFLRPLGAPASWEAALLDLDRARITANDLHRVEIKKKTSSASDDLSRRSDVRAA